MTLRKTKMVDFKSKEKFVQNIFSKVSGKYDLMNDVMSFGIHRLWKKKFIQKITDNSVKLLDVAGGTGDISIQYYLEAVSRDGNPDITLLDLNLDMLNKARENLINQNLVNKFKLVCGNAQLLPFADDVFDYYTISFGIRNVDDISRALHEAYRVLKPGGKFLCLEFSRVDNQLFRKFYNLYSHFVIPVIGEKITGSKESYQYLVDSIRMFPGQENFRQMIESVGFKATGFENLTNGIAAIHWGYKL